MTQLNIKVEPVGTDIKNVTWVAQMVDDAGNSTRTYQGTGPTRDDAITALRGLYKDEVARQTKEDKAQQVTDALKAQTVIVLVNW